MVTKTPKVEEAPTQGSLIEVALDLLQPNPWDPRLEERTPEAVRDMAQSLLQVGLLQTLTVRPGSKDGQYELAFGMTRLLAMRQLADAGQWPQTIAVVLRELTDAQMAIIALTENNKRTDLTPLQNYRAYKKALETIPDLTVTDLATSLGLDHSTLSNAMRLLKLPPAVLQHVESGEMSAFAAREFLCLAAEDHMHIDIMNSVVMEVAKTRLGAGPDWRAPNIRRLIRDRVYKSTVQQWRRVGSLSGKDASHFDYGSSHRTDPLFDVEAFQRELPTSMHTIPWDASTWSGGGGERTTKERSLAMTCDVKAWGRRHEAAKRETAKGETAGGSGPARPPAAPPEQERMRDKALATDPVARKLAGGSQVSAGDSQVSAGDSQVSVETPEAVADVPQSTSKRQKRAKAVAVSAMTPEMRQALGTRDKTVNLGKYSGFHKTLDRSRYGGPPLYFPDIDECLQRCTDGATYGYEQYDSSPVLCCFNKKHYDEKLAAGKATAEAEFKGHLEDERTATQEMAKDLFLLLSDRRLARMVSLALVSGHDLRYQGYRGLEKYEPYTLLRVRELLGLPKGHDYQSLGDPAKLLKRIPAAPREAQTEIAALLLIHTLRSNELSVLDGGQEEEP
jgi:ParB/RepB/Spo0J family partition protein